LRKVVNKQTDRQTNNNENITSLAEVTNFPKNVEAYSTNIHITSEIQEVAAVSENTENAKILE